jgi:peptidoglycan/xylan/chitin deacetylase (PgdA/CDA1 family)
VVALTFDAGSGAQGLPSILHTLADTHVRATFFLTGNFAGGNRTLVRQVVGSGHVVGNHTLSHPHLTKLDTSAVEAQVTQAARALRDATGVDPRPWFRFPFGEYDGRTLATVNRLGYTAIGWTVDTRGWMGREGGTVDDVVRRVLDALSPGEIVLMHVGANPDDGTTFDADALPRVIAAIRAAGYGFTTVAAQPIR